MDSSSSTSIQSSVSPGVGVMKFSGSSDFLKVPISEAVPVRGSYHQALMVSALMVSKLTENRRPAGA